MIWPERPLARRNGPLEQRLCSLKIVLPIAKLAQVVEAGRRLGMVRAELLLTNGERALQHYPSIGKFAASLHQTAKISQVSRRVGMIGPQRLFANSKGTL